MDLKLNRRPRLSRNSLSVLLLTVVGAPSVAGALDLGYSLGYGLEYTDNALLTPDNKQEEWTNSLRAGFSLLQSSPTVEARIASDAEYRNYKNNTSPDETLFNLNLLGKWNISPQRFSWTVEDYFNQTAINPVAPNTPNNRQNTNTLSTGPDFTWRMSPVHALEFGARHARNTYQTTEIDNTRVTGYARWAYQSTPSTRLSLELSAESVNYDDQQASSNINFDRRDAFFEVSNRLARNQLVLDAGTTRISRDNAQDETGELGRFSWIREISSTATVAMYASSQLSDAGQQALSRGQAASLGPLQPTSPIPVVSGDVFRTKSVELLYSFRRAYGDNVFRAFRQKDEFKTAPENDEDRRGGSFAIGYDFSQAFTSSLFGSYARVEDFVTVPSSVYRDKTFGIGLVNRFIRRLSLALDLRENRRDGNNVSITNNYTEHRGMLTLIYSDIRTTPVLQ